VDCVDVDVGVVSIAAAASEVVVPSFSFPVVGFPRLRLQRLLGSAAEPELVSHERFTSAATTHTLQVASLAFPPIAPGRCSLCR